MGWNNQNVFAQLVIVYGNGTLGFFEYSGQPALGNPPIAWAVPPDVTEDPAGNTLPVSGGFATEGSGAYSQIVSGSVALGSTNPASFVPAIGFGALGFGDALTPGAQPELRLASPETSGGAIRASVWALGKSNSGASPAQVVVNTGNSPSPATSALLEVQGVFSCETESLQEQSGTPGTPTGAGLLYVDSTGHLHYLGPGGTNTILAGP